MSRRQYTVLTLQVRLRIPPGKSQKTTLAWVNDQLRNKVPLDDPYLSQSTFIKVVGRETIYLN